MDTFGRSLLRKLLWEGDGRGFNLVANCLALGVNCSTFSGFGLKDEGL